MLDAELRREVDALWDKFWAGGLANPLMAIDQMNYLIFLNRLEHVDTLEQKRADSRGIRYKSTFAGYFESPKRKVRATECRFSFWSNLPAEEMFEHLQTVVFPWMKALAPENHAFTSFMRDAAFLIPKPSLLVEAVNVIRDLKITDRNLDTQGDIYEYMLGKLGVAGQIGQFRTPRHIIRTIVAMVDPQLGEVVIDPACGTAGFLIAAYQHMIAAATSEEFLTHDEDGAPQNLLGDRLTRRQWQWLRNGGLVGYDFDPSMVRIAAMNMVLHGIPRPEVSYADALGKTFSHSPRAKVVLANPPFSGSVDMADISDDFTIRTGKTELLFLDLFQQILLPGGRAGVVVPDSVLFSTRTKTHKTFRRNLIENHGLEGVVHFPSGVFRPYSSVATAVLIFTKDGTTQNVWMYGVTADGYSLDDRRVPIAENDLSDLLNQWTARSTGEHSLLVSADAIRSAAYDLSINTYRSVAHSQSVMRSPAEILDAAQLTTTEVQKGLDELRKMLA